MMSEAGLVETDRQTAGRSGGGALHALAMVAAKRGLSLSVDKLRRDSGLGREQPSLAALERLAGVNGLKARATRLGWRHLTKLGQAFPVILRLNSGGFIVAEQFRADDNLAVLLVRDPMEPGAPAVAIDELRLTASWSGETLLVKRQSGLSEADEPFGFGWMLKEILREKQLFRDIAIAALIMSVLALMPPFFYMVIIDRVLVHHRLSTLAMMGIAIGAVLLFDTLLGFLRRAMVAAAAAKIDARVSLYIFDKLLKLPIDYFDRNPTGMIANKLGEVRRVRMFLTGQLFGALLDGTTLLALIPAMIILNATLSLFVLGIGALMALVIILYMGPMKRAYARVIATENRKQQMLIETIQGMRTIKTLALEGRKLSDWDTRVADSVKTMTAVQNLANMPQTLLAPLEKSIYAGSLGLGAYLAITQTDAVFAGTLVAFTMIATRATQPIMQLAGLMQQVQEARGALMQVASVVNTEPEAQRSSGVRPEMNGVLSFEGVRFFYPNAVSPALDGIDFEVRPGTIVGVMGRSGSGKTTVTRLLQGLHQTYEGLIKVDGVDLREIDLRHLRSRMGVVLQDSFLFQGTIRDNILAPRPDASAAEMIEAARLAGAEEFIERLPRGYETMIEEHASNLSGGQRQRLAIARALVTDPPLLIFDEATSALDPDSEAIINANLRRIAAKRTVIVISHRLASLVDCDQILVFERGRKQDSGSHAELLKRCDIYRHLWSQQNRHLATGGSHDRVPLGAVARG